MKLLQGIFCVLLVASLAYAAEKVIIDDFTSSQSLQIAIQPPFPNIIASSTTGTMTGGERDMRLFGFSGTTGIFVSSQVLGGNWFLACQRGANCQSSLTFDGRDNSPNIAFSGLGSFDFTNNGANALTLTVETDINTFYNLTFYETGTNGARSASARFPTLTGPPQEYIVPFSSFTTVTGMDFTRVGSFVLFAEGGVDVDSTAQLFATFANDISGNVWRDCDRSGTKDNGELNFSGVPVTVFDAVNNDIVETVITDASGNFVASVVPGSYRVCASPSVGSPTVPANNCTTVSVVIAQDVTGINFGFTIPVTVTPPPTRNVNCSSSTLPASTGTATGTGCSAPTITFSDSNSTSCIGEVTITRTWTATLGPDSASGIQIITTFDDNAPIFSNFPANRNLQCGADTSPDAQGRPTATDNCSFGNIGFVDIAPTGGNGCSAPFQRQWTATDACGNFVNRNQSISITDNGAPFFDFFPDNVTVDCSQGTTPATTGSPSADDACTEIASLTFVDTNSTSGCNRVITRAWTARDSCGNVVTRNQQIRTRDSQAPTFFQFPNDVNVNCGTSTAPQFTGGAANATDDCGTATVSFRDTAPSTGCSAPIARNWTVIDNCGNAFSRIQNIFVVDETIPNFTNFPATFTGTCSQSRDPSVTGRPGATDSCTSVAPEDITFSDAVSNDDCTVTIVRTWTIEDTCGNINTRDQSLTYTDRQNPTFVTFPNSVSVNCNEGTTPSTTGTPTVDDDCTDVPSLSFADSINGDGCTGGISRTWTVEDDCGNFVTRVQTITITDTVRPEFVNFPEDRSIQCTDDKSTASNGFPSASDNCDSDPDITFTDRETGALCPNGITLTRTFRVTDLCGNFNTRDQTIEIDLDQDPIIVIPDDTTIDCDDSILPSNTGGSATATSPCDPNVRILPYVDTVVTESCPRTISRLWTAQDTCGNDATGTQIITQTDLERPVLTIPADVTISCADDIDDLAKTGRASATDNCDSSVTPTYTDSAPTTLPVVGTCPADNVVERTWTAIDDCGNVASDVQTITISGTSIGSCRPVPCRPVACDDSSCPEDCPGTPNCLASPCQAQACTRGNCAAERCSTCPVVCKPKACDEIQYIYVDDEDDIPGN